MKKILLVIGSIILFSIAQAQVATFQKIFGYANGYDQWSDGAMGVYQLPDSSIFVLSLTAGPLQRRIVITNFTASGIMISEKPYGTDSIAYFSGQQGTLKQTFDSNFACAGSEPSPLDDNWGILWKFNSNGDSLLKRDYGSLGENDTFEVLYDLVQLPDSGFAMVGFKELNPDSFVQNNVNIWLVRTNAAGNILWQKQFDEAESDVAYHIALFDSAHLIVSGFKKEFGASVDTPWVFVTDFSGNITSERSFSNPPYNCWDAIGPRIFKGIDRTFLFTGCLNGALQNGFFETPLYVAKMDTDLQFIWEHDFNSANVIYIYHARQNEDSSIMIIGYQQDSISGRVWGWMAKLDNNGNLIWDKLYKHGSSFTNYFWDIDQTFDCGFVCVGTTEGPDDQDAWIVKTDRFGCISPVCDTMPSSCANIPTSNSDWFDVSLLTLDVKLYPNPCSDELNIFYNLPDKTTTAQLQIFDVNGRKMAERKLSRASHMSTIAVSVWADGLYLCEIKTATNQLTKKIFIGR